MRKLLLCGSFAVAALIPAAPAHAYGDAPWCVKATIGPGVAVERCDFATFETCNVERPFWGNTGFCVQNSRYLPYWQGEKPVRKSARKKKQHHQS